MDMDTERLKELKEFLSHSFFCYGRRSGKTITSEFFRDVELLIDEALAKQSATSEDVAEAIEYYTHVAKITKGEESLAETSANLAITALQQYQGWIPVSERLPDGDVASVLIYTKEGGVAEGQYYQSIRAWKQFRWSVEDSSVTHWKPLPEPPKGE